MCIKKYNKTIDIKVSLFTGRQKSKNKPAGNWNDGFEKKNELAESCSVLGVVQ